MRIKSVQIDTLRSFARTLDNTELETRIQHKEFLFNVDEKGFYYNPTSTDKPRFRAIPKSTNFLRDSMKSSLKKQKIILISLKTHNIFYQ